MQCPSTGKEVVSSACEYSRYAAVEYQLKSAGLVVTGLSIETVVQLVKGIGAIANGVRRLPPPVQVCLVFAAVVAALPQANADMHIVR